MGLGGRLAATNNNPVTPIPLLGQLLALLLWPYKTALWRFGQPVIGQLARSGDSMVRHRARERPKRPPLRDYQSELLTLVENGNTIVYLETGGVASGIAAAGANDRDFHGLAQACA